MTGKKLARLASRATDVASGLTAETLRTFLSYDKETGQFIWLVQHAKSHAGQIGRVAGCLSKQTGYVLIGLTVNGVKRTYMAHRLAWLYVTGAWPSGEIDHINRNRSDNRAVNLRDVDHFVNMQNEWHARKNNRSGLRGATWLASEGRFKSSIVANGVTHYLGRFQSAEEAHKAYMAAKARMHAEGAP